MLPASMKRADLMRSIRDYAAFQPDYLLFTKLDETESQGAILSAALEAGQAALVFRQRPKHSRRYRTGPCARVARIGVPAGNSGGRYGGIDGFQSISERGLLRRPLRRWRPASATA